jgi:hypothetical protein
MTPNYQKEQYLSESKDFFGTGTFGIVYKIYLII